MAYAALSTKSSAGLSPNFRGYAPLATRNASGIHPNFRGLGQTPLTTVSFGPGGQWSVASASTPTSTSLWDQIMTWMGSSTVIAGMPNSVLAITAGVFVIAGLRKGR
jgi:hypothetical protein